MIIENVKRISIDPHRWYAYLDVELQNGSTKQFKFDTGDGNGLGFCSKEDFKEFAADDEEW